MKHIPDTFLHVAAVNRAVTPKTSPVNFRPTEFGYRKKKGRLDEPASLSSHHLPDIEITDLLPEQPRCKMLKHFSNTSCICHKSNQSLYKIKDNIFAMVLILINLTPIVFICYCGFNSKISNQAPKTTITLWISRISFIV